MNLYLITQDHQGYDTYDEMVVRAESKQQAYILSKDRAGCDIYSNNDEWNFTNNMKFELLASSVDGGAGVVCASFNAG